MRRLLAVAALAAVALLGACGGGDKSTTASPSDATTPGPASTSSMLPEATGQTYLAIVGPANAARDKANAKMKALPENPTSDQVADIVEPLIPIFADVENNLLRANWPAKVLPDIKSLVTASGQLRALFGSSRGQSIFSYGSFSTALTKAYGEFGSASQIVRADLGLPPPAGG